jgi:hypothetical protein
VGCEKWGPENASIPWLSCGVGGRQGMCPPAGPPRRSAPGDPLLHREVAGRAATLRVGQGAVPGRWIKGASGSVWLRLGSGLGWLMVTSGSIWLGVISRRTRFMSRSSWALLALPSRSVWLNLCALLRSISRLFWLMVPSSWVWLRFSSCSGRWAATGQGAEAFQG